MAEVLKEINIQIVDNVGIDGYIVLQIVYNDDIRGYIFFSTQIGWALAVKHVWVSLLLC